MVDQQAAGRRHGEGAAVLAMAGVSLIWGIAFPLTKTALEDIPPFTFAFLRFSVALLCFVPLAGGAALRLLRGPDGTRLALMGLIGFCGAQLAQTLALKLSPASDIVLIATLAPVWIVLLAWLWLGESFGHRTIVGFVIAIAGLLLILWPREVEAVPAGQRILGDLIFLANGLTWAIYNVMGKQMMLRYEPMPVITAAGIVGTLALLPFAAGEWLSGHTPRLTPIGVAAVAYTGLLVTVLGFMVLFWALSRVRAARVAITMYLQPLTGVLLAWLWLGEPISWLFLAGAALVLAGVRLVR